MFSLKPHNSCCNKKATHLIKVIPYILDVWQSLPVTEEVITQLRLFTLRIVYNDPVSVSLRHSRASKWIKMKTKSTRRLPPDEDSHQQRAARINYVCNILMSYHSKNAASSPFSHGWSLLDGKYLLFQHNLLTIKNMFKNTYHISSF